MVSFCAYFYTIATVVVTTVRGGYTGLSSTYGGPDGVDASTGNCGPMAALPSATKYHVAMNDPQYIKGLHCGRCVQIQCTDPRCNSNKVMMAQITDRCPECKSGDLDMTLPLFQELTGYQTDKYAISWSFVDCPVDGGIQVCAKDGSSKYWLFVQPMNTVSGVRSMKINGGTADPFPSNYYFMSTKLGVVELGDTDVEMTSWAGETIKTTVALQAGACTQIRQQFSTGLPTFEGGVSTLDSSSATSSTVYILVGVGVAAVVAIAVVVFIVKKSRENYDAFVVEKDARALVEDGPMTLFGETRTESKVESSFVIL
ncbi:Aste57867_21819 [Aphanomyces stellatus]|uniref:Aste57867_21819 protein n=1 Tax=Aphanomyces stellatus TaxID=120398 RepID=A0A485LJ78_9STRA|nr:hypothetical protein As57867_021750 [Aphanomyces stellatus]VFT98488.1 Aste57867_21819 [Aphanomyces stellatus]